MTLSALNKRIAELATQSDSNLTTKFLYFSGDKDPIKNKGEMLETLTYMQENGFEMGDFNYHALLKITDQATGKSTVFPAPQLGNDLFVKLASNINSFAELSSARSVPTYPETIQPIIDLVSGTNPLLNFSEVATSDNTQRRSYIGRFAEELTLLNENVASFIISKETPDLQRAQNNVPIINTLSIGAQNDLGTLEKR